MKLIKFFALVATMTLMFATGSAAAPAGNLIPKINSFDFLVDISGSMMMKNNAGGLLTKNTAKLDTAKKALTRVNAQIPALGYKGSLHTFAYVEEILPQTTYNAATLQKAIDHDKLKSNKDIYGRNTPMGDGIGALAGAYNTMSRKAGVIMVTDGASNYGSDPVDQVKALYQANPDICVHVISLADTPAGKQTIKDIAALRNCSVVAEAETLVSNDAAVDQFVKDVFYDTVGGSRIDLRSVQFGFDSAAITNDSAVVLDEVAKILAKSPRSVEITGHTCSIGSADYNLGLSNRRAEAVKSYLVKKGVPASSITAKGYGLTQPKFDNSKEEGRRLNRRAEIN
ncbi:membrane protein [Deltaproteobacteria bacterium]|nr:membrane protein [Deltaproteobacteria bacterium]